MREEDGRRTEGGNSRALELLPGDVFSFAMDDPLPSLLLVGFGGWFLVHFLIDLRRSDAPRALASTAFAWIVGWFLLGVPVSIEIEKMRKTGFGWGLVIFFLALPYLLGTGRLVQWWFSRRRQTEAR